MKAREYYLKETGNLPYKFGTTELEFTDDYIRWLEEKVVKLFESWV